MNLPDLTVVVTTFKRPDHLRRCLQSLVNAGIKSVVVSASSSTDDETKICDEFSNELSITRSLLAYDLGCNETWMRGVTLANTKYVLILHDDDRLLPDFGKTYVRDIYPQLIRGVGFATWRGQVVDEQGNCDTETGCLRGDTRVTRSHVVTHTIMDPEVIPPSPVISVFQRQVTIRALREAEQYFTDPKFFSRPNMMIGNELLIYLRHAEQFDEWLFLDKILTEYGDWAGSETVLNRSTNLVKLKCSHNHVREHFRSVRLHQVQTPAKFFHVWSDFVGDNPETHRRHTFAQRTWESYLSLFGEVVSIPMTSAPRSSKQVVGDSRDLPFIRDMLDTAASYALPEDCLLMSNSDICFVPDAVGKMRAILDNHPCFFAWRRNFYHPLTVPFKDIRKGSKDGGVDLVGFRRAAWLAHREQFPDFILGCEAWDYCYRILIPEIGGHPGSDDLIYHEYHDPVWRKAGFRAKNPGQRFNRALAENFFRRRSQSAGGVPKFEL